MGKKTYQQAAQNGQMPLITPESDWVAPTELPDLRARKIVAIDSETKDDGLAAGSGAGWAFGAGYIAGVCVAAPGDFRTYIPIRHPDTPECFSTEQVGRWYKDHVRAGVRFVMQKAIYDCGWFRTEWDAAPPDELDDTMIMQYMLDENRLEYGLDSICRDLGIPGKDEHLLREAAATYLGAATEQQVKSQLWRLPARYVGPYGEQDAVSTLRARELLWPRIQDEELENAYQLEMDLLPLILEMRRRGIRVDEEYAEHLRADFAKQRDAALRELTRHLGGRALTMKDINSNGWKRQAFDRENIKYPWTAGTSKKPPSPSFEADWMEKVDHWLPQLVVQASQFNDAGEKFVGNYIQNYTHRGRIHAEIHQTKGEDGGTSTTRMAYSDPPLQQMPSRHPQIGPALRKCFLPEVGELWGAPDYSQQEFRLITHFASVCRVAGADEPVRIYREDPKADFHNIVVELTGLVRNTAKDTNFAKAFRAGVPKFASMIGKSVEEAKAIYDQYDEKMPFVSRLAEFCDGRAQQRGYLKLIGVGNGPGTKAHFDKWEAKWVPKDERARGYREGYPMDPCSKEEAAKRTRTEGHPWFGQRLKRAFTYKAVNRLVQGSAAQQTKMAMRACWREGIVPLIQLHDELGVSCPDERRGLRVAELMRDAVQLVVPTIVDLEYGMSFGEARVIKDPVTKAVTYDASWDAAWAAMQARAAA